MHNSRDGNATQHSSDSPLSLYLSVFISVSLPFSRSPFLHRPVKTFIETHTRTHKTPKKHTKCSKGIYEKTPTCNDIVNDACHCSRRDTDEHHRPYGADGWCATELSGFRPVLLQNSTTCIHICMCRVKGLGPFVSTIYVYECMFATCLLSRCPAAKTLRPEQKRVEGVGADILHIVSVYEFAAFPVR